MTRILFLTLISISAFQSNAETIVQKKQKARFVEETESYLANTNEACGTKLAFDFDQPSFAAFSEQEFDDCRVSALCSQVISAAEIFCRQNGDSAKKMLASKVKKFSCGLGGKGKQKFSLKGSTLDLRIDCAETTDASPDYANQLKTMLK